MKLLYSQKRHSYSKGQLQPFKLHGLVLQEFCAQQTQRYKLKLVAELRGRETANETQ